MSVNSRLLLLIEAWPKLSEVTIVGRKSTDDEVRRYEALFWAATAMTRLIEQRPKIAFEVIYEIMQRTDKSEILEHLAAGPLEDLLSKNTLAVNELTESRAASDPKFKSLLQNVWRNMMSDNTWQRICAARQM